MKLIKLNYKFTVSLVFPTKNNQPATSKMEAIQIPISMVAT